MPETLIQNMEKIAVAIGAAVLVLVGLWSRFAGLFPARRPKDGDAPARKSDVEALRDLIDHMARQQEEFHADNRKADERLHERVDALLTQVHDIDKQQARMSTACTLLRDQTHGRPAE